MTVIGFIKRVRVGRITTGHGTSELGVEVTINEWNNTDIPDLVEGEYVDVTITRATRTC